jgi:hypothetical protein
MANPKHPEHANLKEWYGGSFDPSTPPADELRFEVLKLAKRWKTKNTIKRTTWPQRTAYHTLVNPGNEPEGGDPLPT